MKKVTCDACAAPLGPVGFAVVWAGTEPHEVGDAYRIVGDYCSAQCIVRALNAVGVRRPDFDAARTAVGDALYEQAQLDEAAMLGAYDNQTDIEAALPYSPVAPFNGGPPRQHSLAAADAQRVLGAKS